MVSQYIIIAFLVLTFAIATTALVLSSIHIAEGNRPQHSTAPYHLHHDTIAGASRINTENATIQKLPTAIRTIEGKEVVFRGQSMLSPLGITPHLLSDHVTDNYGRNHRIKDFDAMIWFPSWMRNPESLTSAITEYVDLTFGAFFINNFGHDLLSFDLTIRFQVSEEKNYSDFRFGFSTSADELSIISLVSDGVGMLTNLTTKTHETLSVGFASDYAPSSGNLFSGDLPTKASLFPRIIQSDGTFSPGNSYKLHLSTGYTGFQTL